MSQFKLSLGQAASLACLLEVSAPKPGNVHRGADFEDMQLNDFLASAVALGPVYDQVATRTVGQTVLAAVEATHRLVKVNTNLGINLLFAPLAKAAISKDTTSHERQTETTVDAASVGRVLSALTAEDAQQVYAAIRRANPGGMAGVQQTDPASDSIANDVRGEAPSSLLTAMSQAATWDRIAWQFAHAFSDVFDRIVPWLVDESNGATLNDRVVATHVRMMSECPDTLIARKCGQDVARQAAARAGAVVATGIGSADYYEALADLDFWLRSDGHRRNPGTTADLVAAGLFVALVNGKLEPPFH